MRNSSRLPSRLPAGSKYVLEARGALVHRYVELPDGRRINLRARKAVTCCAADATLVPKLGAVEPVRARAKYKSAVNRRSRATV